jgi:hypothetical protein
MSVSKLTSEIITAAIEGFQSQKNRIDDQIAELRAVLSGVTTQPTAMLEAHTGKRRKFSAAARKRMREAQQRRWAKIRGESGSPASATAEPGKPKRRISEEGMKRIIAATKKRWRLQKAAAKAKAPVKKATVKKAAVKTAPAKAAKRAPIKKAVAKKSAPAPARPSGQ